MFPVKSKTGEVIYLTGNEISWRYRVRKKTQKEFIDDFLWWLRLKRIEKKKEECMSGYVQHTNYG